MENWIQAGLKALALLCMTIAVCCSRSALTATLINIARMQKEIPGKNPLVKQAQLNFYAVVIILGLMVSRVLEIMNDQAFLIFLTATLGVYGINLTKDKDNASTPTGQSSGNH